MHLANRAAPRLPLIAFTYYYVHAVHMTTAVSEDVQSC